MTVFKFPMSARDFKRIRNRAFETDNVDMIRDLLPRTAQSESLLIAFHKARYECVEVSERKRLESQQWMIINGVRRLNGSYVEPGEPLPVNPDLWRP